MYERFELLLNEAKITAYRFAQETGIRTSTLSAWKKGLYTPKSEKLETIAAYFGVSVDWLLGKTDDRQGMAIKIWTIKDKPKKPKDLRRLLKDEEITLNGRLMSEEDKQKMYKIIEAAFWDAKEANKKKKNDIKIMKITTEE